MLGTLAPACLGATILVFGDSLSAGYGLARDQSWPALLANRLAQKQPSLQVVNASISGETTAGGRSRLEADLKRHQPRIVILELGANDGLRGLPVSAMKDNLAAMIRTARANQAKVLLVGMKLPPNYGTDYLNAFENAYRELARQEKVAFVPFLLEPIANDRANFQQDGLHPLATAQGALLDHVWPGLSPLLTGVK